MRELKAEELSLVSGAGGSCACYCPPPPPKHKNKGNNGYGHGGNDGVPGNSNKQDKTR